MNIFQQLNARLMGDAANRMPMIQEAARQQAIDRLEGKAKGFADRTPENANAVLAEFLSQAGKAQDRRSVMAQPGQAQGGASPLADADRMRAYEAIRSQLGMSQTGAAQVTPESMGQFLGKQDAAGRLEIGRQLAAAQGPGIRDRIRSAELEYNRRLAATGMEGNIARGGTYAAIAGGAVAGGAAMTAPAQELIALMEYLTAGRENEQAAENSPLA